MAIPTVRKVSEKYYYGRMADISTAVIEYFGVVGRGKLKTLIGCISATITGDSVVTVKVNGTTTGQTLTFTGSGSSAGSRFTLNFTGDVMVDAGDLISLDNDGGSTNTSIATFTLVVDEG